MMWYVAFSTNNIAPGIEYEGCTYLRLITVPAGLNLARKSRTNQPPD